MISNSLRVEGATTDFEISEWSGFSRDTSSVPSVDDARMKCMSWRCAQPRHGDLKTLFPWPQYASHFPLLVSPVYADVQLSTQIGMISRCRDLGQVHQADGQCAQPGHNAVLACLRPSCTFP